ncbi:MAG: DUF3179 domain-containing protein [Chloroflexi bacterium]|nr:DUF3179 domain-containing protein [Chloroflexota bacterium]
MILAVAFAASAALPSRAQPFLNGFNLTNSIIPISEIVRGGPPRDGIPAIDNPKFLQAQDATFLGDSDLVIGLSRGGLARAYPLRIMLWHEVVNEQFGEEPLTVTYCPLCGTAVVFDAMINGQRLNFGVSGLLYQSDVLMYDRQTESLWSQLLLKAVTGTQMGQALKIVPSQVLTWAAWRKKFPNTEVLSTETGFRRDYTFNPYEGYDQSQSIWFGVPIHRQDFDNKDFVLGILVGNQAKAYALERLPTDRAVTDVIGDVTLRISYDPASQEPTVLNAASAEPFPFIQSFWFAWQAFYPETDVWAPMVLALDRSLRFSLSGEKNKRYTVEVSEDLRSWSPLTTLAPTNGFVSFQDPNGPQTQRFYRARREP